MIVPAPPSTRTTRASGLLAASGVLGLLERVPAWRGVLVLNYHRIGDPASSFLDHGVFSATPEAFEAHVRHLARRTQVIRLEDLPACLARGRGRRVAVTFDDGYRDNYEHALPVLRRYGVHATFFLTTGFLDGPALAWWDETAWIMRRATVDQVPPLDHLPEGLDLRGPDARERAIETIAETYKRLPAEQAEALMVRLRDRARAPEHSGPSPWMSWDMAREIRDAGMGIGGHTVHHPVLANVDDARLASELGGCAERLRDELGVDMRMFAYPVGRPESYDARAVEQLRALGVRIACAFHGGFARPGHADLLQVPRATVSVDMSLATLRLRAALPQRFATW